VTLAISKMDAAGTLTGDELVEVSQLSTTVTMTAATLSALASDNSYNDSANGFVTEGFEVGMRVRVTGFTGNVANNIFSATITALTAGKMTIGGTDGDVIVDDAAGESVTITKWETYRVSAQELADLGTPTESIIIACGDEATPIATGAAKVTFRMPYAFTLSEVRASVTDAPTGAAIIIDINEGGASVLSTKLSIDAGEKTSESAATPAVISDAALADDAEITVDFDQVGSTLAGAGVKVTLIGSRT
jgi:hypothetical protein